MTEQIKLVRTADWQSDISELNLTTMLGEDGWVASVMDDDADSVGEVLNLVQQSTSHDDAASDFQSIYQKIREFNWGKSGAQPYQIWLRDQLSGESNPRQAIVRLMRFAPDTPLHDHPMTLDYMAKGTLGLERGHWESVSSFSSDLTNISGVGGVTDAYGSAVPGDVAGRIGYVSFVPYAGSGALTDLWWGFKTNKDGITLANWKGLWELELGTASTDTSATTDATASPGGGGNTKMACNFATVSSMSKRVTLTPYEIDSTNYADLRGTYKLLLRAKIDTGYVCRVRLAYDIASAGAYTGANALTYNDQVTISSTLWNYYDLGQITLPCGGPGNASYSAMKNSSMQIQAQLYSGTQSGSKYLHMDCLVAIPVDEGYGHLSRCSGVKGEALVDALGRISSNDYTSTNITGILNTDGLNAHDCVMPVGTIKIIVAAQRNASTVLADAANVSFKVFPRWRVLRGSA